MAELTIEQQRAIALAKARARMAPAEKTPKYKIGREGWMDAVRSVIEDEKKSKFPGATEVSGMLMAGPGAFADNMSLRLKQLFGNELTPEDEMNVQFNREVMKDPAGLVGSVAPLVPIGVNSVLGNTVLGAGYGGLTQPVLEGESGTENTLWGGAAGFGAGILGKLLTGGGLVTRSKATDDLMKEGIVPTIGQNAQSKGLLGRAIGGIEEKASSIPIIGDFIRMARARAVSDLNKAVISKATAPGSKVAQIGKEGVEEALDSVSRAYQSAYKGIKVSPSRALLDKIDDAVDVPAAGLSDSAKQKFTNIIKRFVKDRFKPDMDAGLVKKTIESDLGKEANAYLRNPNSDDKALGEALRAARDAIRDHLRNAAGKVDDLAILDKTYAIGKTAQKASEKASAQGGIFTPYQLQKAAGERGLLRPLADQAQSVLGSRMPNSGTTDRALQALLFSGQFPGTGGLGYLAGGLTAGPVYSKMGQQLLLGGWSPFEQYAPFVASALRSGYLNQGE